MSWVWKQLIAKIFLPLAAAFFILVLPEVWWYSSPHFSVWPACWLSAIVQLQIPKRTLQIIFSRIICQGPQITSLSFLSHADWDIIIEESIRNPEIEQCPKFSSIVISARACFHVSKMIISFLYYWLPNSEQ